MLLVGAGLRVALATTHLPLAEGQRRHHAGAARERCCAIIDARPARAIRRAPAPHPRARPQSARRRSGAPRPRGDRGDQADARARCASEGLRLDGPVPADTAFLPHRLEGVDAVLAMFHDQGLPVLKYASFGHAVNVTLGLPIVRTSVDHGTALDLAGTRQGRPGQPARRRRPRRRARCAPLSGPDVEAAAPRSATASTSCTTRARSIGSCAPSRRRAVSASSKSAPVAAPSPPRCWRPPARST